MKPTFLKELTIPINKKNLFTLFDMWHLFDLMEKNILPFHMVLVVIHIYIHAYINTLVLVLSLS